MKHNHEPAPKLCETKQDLILFVKALETSDWCGCNEIPEPRFPILALVCVGDGFEDDMDLNGDEGLEESMIENNGEYIPVCGTSYDGGSEWVITPFVSSCSDTAGVTFISWNRVHVWRYLTEEEGLYKWRSLLKELPDEEEEDDEKEAAK